ncbi:SMP-30/gluconolactonase/LRE family protein [Salinicola avicenniae]|uniref:SMP-30/gluconolactonase/LRE family protein n=1 Tax=Salinicola avicenniae TaxID=2916836 RepID=UPI0020734848|nr:MULTISPECIES: SMP-30/gluconolactonase/LRE family protein [unclassified Salinicola]
MPQDATVIWPANAELGEGPVWSPEHRALLFVDIRRARLHAWHPDSDERQSWTLDEACCWLLPREGGDFVAGLRSGIVELSLDATGPHPGKRLTPIDWLPEGDRLNDAKSDREGRLWFGSMDNAETHANGYLYRLDGRGLSEVDRDYAITNGPAIAPDGRTLYHNDSARQTVFAFDLNDAGELSGKRELIRLPSGRGFPDGMTCDHEGNLWIALWDGARVARYRPDGQLDREVSLPVSRPTSCAFGGDNLERLFVTSAATGCPDEPLAGALFEIVTDIGGLAETPIHLPTTSGL